MSATTEIHADDRNVDPVPGRPDPGRDGAVAGAEGLPAVITLVCFAVPGPPLTPAALRALLDQTAPRYRTVPGLLRKAFLGAEGLGGGLYEWRSRADAAAWFDAAWHERMRATYGVEPRLEWFDVPCLVDNLRGRIDVRLPAGATGPARA